MSSYIMYEKDPLLAAIKGAIAVEYTPAGEWNEVGYMSVLIAVGDSLEWRDVTECLPASSTLEYAKPAGPKVSLLRK